MCFLMFCMQYHQHGWWFKPYRRRTIYVRKWRRWKKHQGKKEQSFTKYTALVDIICRRIVCVCVCVCVSVCVCVFDQFVGLALKSLRLIHNHYFTISFLIVNLHKQYTKRKVLTLNYGKKARLQNCRIFWTITF